MEDKASIARFGATMIRCAGHLLLLGGIASNQIVAKDEEVLTIHIDQDTSQTVRIATKSVLMNNLGPRPLLIGTSIYCIEENVLIMGGGAVCFSFGTFWNRSCFSLRLRKNLGEDRDNQNEIHPIPDLSKWGFLQTVEMVSRGDLIRSLGSNNIVPNAKEGLKTATVPYIRLKSAADFSTIVAAAKPVILQELDIGRCTAIWTCDYLKTQVGSDRMVGTT